MASSTSKRNGNIKRNPTTGCFDKKTTTTTEKKSPRSTSSGQLVSKKSSSNQTTSVKVRSKADKMFERAWKDTYDKRDRRVD